MEKFHYPINLLILKLKQKYNIHLKLMFLMNFEDYNIPKPKDFTIISDELFIISNNNKITTNCVSERFLMHLRHFTINNPLNNGKNKKIQLDLRIKDNLEKSQKYPFGFNLSDKFLYVSMDEESNLDLYERISKIQLNWHFEWNIDDYRATDEYFIIINTSLTIFSRSERGLFYGLRTLEKMIFYFGNNLKYSRIHDYPLLSLRAVHIDLKLNCPNIKFLKLLTKILSAYKINSFIIEWEDKFPFTGELEILRHKAALSEEEKHKLLKSCFFYYIEAIPLIQSLGHFDYVLKHERFKHLSELAEYKCKSEREKRMKYYMFCPSNEDSKKLIRKIHNQILNGMEYHKESNYIHVGMDETYYLGYCDECKRFIDENESIEKDIGKSKLFIDHLNWIAKFHSDRGKFSIVWDDMLVKHPELIEQLDKSIIINDWDYSNPLPQGRNISERIENMDISGFSTNFVRTWKPMTLSEIEKDKPYNYEIFKNYWIIEDKKYKLRAFPYQKYFAENSYKVIAGPAVQSGTHAVFSPDFPIVIKNIIYSNYIAIKNNLFGSLCTNWVVREGLWPIMIYGFLLHGETSWNGEIIKGKNFTPKFILNLFFNSINTDIINKTQKLNNLFYVLGLISLDYDIYFNEMTEIQRFESKFDKKEYSKYIPERLLTYKRILTKLESTISKNKEIYNTILLNVNYNLILDEIVNNLGKIEKIAEKLDMEEEISISIDELEKFEVNIHKLDIKIKEFAKKLEMILKWHLKECELTHNFDIRIKSVENHVKIAKNALDFMQQGIERFTEIIMELKLERFGI